MKGAWNKVRRLLSRSCDLRINKSGDCKKPLKTSTTKILVLFVTIIYIHECLEQSNASEGFFYRKLFISRHFWLNIPSIINLTIMLDNAPKPVHFQPTNIINDIVFPLHVRFFSTSSHDAYGLNNGNRGGCTSFNDLLSVIVKSSLYVFPPSYSTFP